MSRAFAPAGLVSGPRMLKTVRTPICRLIEATFFIAGWKLGANMNPTPISSIAFSTSAGSISGCGDYKGGSRADVEGLCLVSASTARVQQVAVNLRTYSSTESPHHSSYGSDLVNGFSLLLQPYQERRDLCWCGLSSHDVHHCSLRLVSG